MPDQRRFSLLSYMPERLSARVSSAEIIRHPAFLSNLPAPSLLCLHHSSASAFLITSLHHPFHHPSASALCISPLHQSSSSVLHHLFACFITFYRYICYNNNTNYKSHRCQSRVFIQPRSDCGQPVNSFTGCAETFLPAPIQDSPASLVRSSDESRGFCYGKTVVARQNRLSDLSQKLL